MGVWRKGFQDVMRSTTKWKILRGDKVMITAGKDAGQVGTVLKVLRDSKFPRVIVEGLNLNKRCIKRTKDNPGGVVSVESPLHYSNVTLLDPVTSRPVRVSWRFLEDGTRVRVTRGRAASASIVPKPDVLKQRGKPRSSSAGPADTKLNDAAEVTHQAGDLPSLLKERLAHQARHVQQQHARQYHTSTAAAASSSRNLACAAALRILGGGVQQLLGRGSMRGHWWGFAASSLS